MFSLKCDKMIFLAWKIPLFLCFMLAVSHNEPVTNFAHIHSLFDDFWSGFCFAKLDNVFDVAETVLAKGHALLLERLHQETKTVEVFRDSQRSIFLHFLLVGQLFFHVFFRVAASHRFDILKVLFLSCFQILEWFCMELFGGFCSDWGPLHLINIRKQTEKGSVKSHAMSDFACQFIVRKKTLIRVVPTHQEVKFRVSRVNFGLLWRRFL